MWGGVAACRTAARTDLLWSAVQIPLRAIETMRKGGGGLGFGLAKPFHIKINARLSDDPAASKTPLTVEFGTKRDQRDRVLALMGVRGAGSSGRGRSTSSPR